jgi:CubicO group peptidase (beta-lactamase class C family)
MIIDRSRFLTGLVFSLGAAQVPARSWASSQEASLAAYLDIFAHRSDFYGAVALRRGVSVSKRSVGYGNVAAHERSSDNSAYLVGSVSKHFTSVAILLLQRAGKLRIDEPIGRFLPELADKNITPLQIMTHRSGLPRDFLPGTRALSPQQSLKAAEAMKLVSPAGSKFAYSNVGYAVLAAVIERVSDEPFNDYMRTHVLQPAGMTHSGLVGKHAPDHLATGYLPGLGTTLVAVPDAWRDALAGPDSVYATVDDMLRWDRALWGGHVLSKSELAALIEDRGDHYGLGLSNDVRGGRRVVGHDGQTTGFISRYDHFPDAGAAAIMLGNVDTGAESVLAAGITNILFGARPDQVSLPVLVTKRIAASQAAHYAGTYLVSPQFDFKVEYRGGNLYIPGNGARPAALSPTADGEFFYRELYARVRFAGDPGPAPEMVWTDSGGTYHCKRKAVA